VPGAGELRVLRRRIRSVRSTQKITRSFELIAASRIARARRAVEAARPYASLVTRVIRDLSTEVEATSHPLLAPRERTRAVGVLVIASDRGLAGSYNTNVLRRAERLLREEADGGRPVVLFTVGRKAEGYFRYRGYEPARAWAGISDQPTYQAAREVGEALTEAYVTEGVDRVWMVYTDFKSALSQVSATAKVLPVDPVQFEGGTAYPPTFEFEPDPASILSQLIPRYIEQRIYAGLLESAASEHASRQRAMKAATDNAGDIIEDLTREANRARQAAITTEISEIVGGAEALSKR
jgi:F-type H+-transporting ATPase subunit gamma